MSEHAKRASGRPDPTDDPDDPDVKRCKVQPAADLEAEQAAASLKRLYALNLYRETGKADLKIMNKMLELLGHPERGYRIVHVAGTNGKGSVCLMMETALTAAGFKVGMFTSPHLSSFRERVRIGGVMMTRGELAQNLAHILTVAESNGIPLIFFEATVLLGLVTFSQRKVEWAVIEVGIGGRLDSTNIIQPALSIVTSIGLDHCRILGDTLEQIAKEKAGIIKPGCPVVVGWDVPVKIFEDTALALKAPFFQTPLPSLPQEYQAENANVAKLAMDVLQQFHGDVEATTQITAFEVRQPCRMERVPDAQLPTGSHAKSVFLDVAHNAHGLAKALPQMAHRDGATTLVMAFSKGKDIGPMLRCVLTSPHVDHLYLTTTKHPRLPDPLDLWKEASETWASLKLQLHQSEPAECSERQGERESETTPTTEGTPKATDSAAHHSCQLQPLVELGDVRLTIQRALRHKTNVLICGSFFIMEDARAALSFRDERDHNF